MIFENFRTQISPAATHRIIDAMISIGQCRCAYNRLNATKKARGTKIKEYFQP